VDFFETLRVLYHIISINIHWCIDTSCMHVLGAASTHARYHISNTIDIRCTSRVACGTTLGLTIGKGTLDTGTTDDTTRTQRNNRGGFTYYNSKRRGLELTPAIPAIPVRAAPMAWFAML